MTVKNQVIETLKIADAGAGVRHVFVRDLELTCIIGVHAHEKRRSQRIRVNIDVGAMEGDAPHGDQLENVLDYENLVVSIRAIVADGSINLIETLAERIAEICLQPALARSARVRVEKLDVFSDARSVGVEIERFAASRNRR